ncbi:MAG: ATP-binding protein [Polyangiales bacterium]
MRVALVATGMLFAASTAALATAHLSERAHAHQLAHQVHVGAAALRARHAQDLEASRFLLQRACEGEPDARSVARAIGADAWVLRERGGALERSASDAHGAGLPSRAALDEARTGYVTFVGASPLALLSCARTRDDAREWVVRVEPLARLIARLAPPSLRVLDEAEVARDDRDEHADAIALTLPGADGAPPRALWLRAAEPPSFDALIALAPLALLALGLSALLAYVLARRGVDESVLIELERAAERVAGGDLAARIAVRPGGRADQTFRTFDRMTSELAEMRARLAEAERASAWQDMAQRIAHEIKNPLQPIQMAIETLRKAHQKRLASFDEIFDESSRAILEEVRRLEHIVREFSEFARLPRAKPGALSLAALVDETVALYRPEDVDVRVVHDDGPLPLRADRAQLTQVLVNLLQNALDAARGSAQPRVEVRTSRSRDGDGVMLHVDDSGSGVAKGDHEAVFQPYFTTKPRGTGLGLAIVRRIVLDHGGSVHATEAPLGGARFTVRLPKSA